MIFRAHLFSHALALFISSAFASTPYTAEDAMALKRISQVAPSPSGTQVAYNVIQLVDDGNKKNWQVLVYLHRTDGKNIQITPPSEFAYMISWSPDERYLTFLSASSGGQQLLAYDTQTKKTNTLIKLQTPITAYKWSPDGSMIAYVNAPSKNEKNSRIHVTNIVAPDTAKTLTPANVTISAATSNPALDGGFDWAPDSKSIAYSYQPKTGEAYLNDAKIALIDITSHQVTPLAYTKNHTGGQPRFSRDGSAIAFRTNVPPSEHAAKLNHNAAINNQICVTQLRNGATQCFPNTPNENPTILGWDNNNTTVYVEDTDKTSGHQIYALDPTRSAQQVSQSSDGVIENTQLNQNGTLFGFARESATKPFEVYISSTQSFNPKQITHLQRSISAALPSSSIINWKSTDGKMIEGILLLPPNYDPTKKYPLIVGIHGGPEGVWAQRFTGSCEGGGTMTIPPCWGIMATKGFIILLPNPRGSTGYGREFRTANYADWGGHDYQDIMSGVEQLVRKRVADPNRLAVAGWSYGGYMTNWITTQTNQFKFAVDGAGMSDLLSFFKSTDLENEAEEYFGAPYTQDPTLYIQRSPTSHAANVVTPILIVHGDADNRVPVSQAYEWQRTLTKLHKPVKMTIMKKQAHIPTDAEITLSVIHEIEAWLEQTKN